VLRDAIRGTLDDEVAQVFAKALDDLKAAGAEIVDPAPVDRSDVRRAQGAGACRGFKYDLNEYLAAQGDRVPVKSLDEILAHPDFAKIPPPSQQRLRGQQNASMNGPESEACKAEMAQLIGQTSQQGAGDNSQLYSPTSGFPALSVPMGYTRDGTLPAGITFFGRAWSEETLIKLAYAYEQATKHRKPPATTPPVR
jgi:Asp-tRNA(Asn)/Glu-tRNA(Gln) amidotransferase A subunit family amidase